MIKWFNIYVLTWKAYFERFYPASHSDNNCRTSNFLLKVCEQSDMNTYF